MAIVKVSSAGLPETFNVVKRLYACNVNSFTYIRFFAKIDVTAFSFAFCNRWYGANVTPVIPLPLV